MNRTHFCPKCGLVVRRTKDQATICSCGYDLKPIESANPREKNIIQEIIACDAKFSRDFRRLRERLKES